MRCMAIELTADWTAYSALVTAAALLAGFWVVSRTVTTQPSSLAQEEEEGHQVAPSTTSDFPPGLEQEPPCSNASGPYLATALGIR